MARPAATVVVSTYNRPANLERCLEGYRYQSTGDFELVVADDGSGPETRELVQRYAGLLPVPLRHAWHEDRGFRKCAILNLASQEAQSDYLVYTDGDCVPHRRFVEMHLRHRAPGTFLVGRAAFLSEARSRGIDLARIRRGNHARPTLRDVLDMIRGENRNVNYAIYVPGELGFRLVQRLKKNRNPRGANMSLWKADLERVNGWNEDFESWGLEDVELGYRLRLAGVAPVLVVNRAICMHLWHPAERVEGASARTAYNATKARGLAWCPNGLEKQKSPPPAAHVVLS